jgi:D-alanine-D-alanine ligase
MSRAAVIFGGPSPEHEVSILTGLRAARALVGSNHDPYAIYWTKTQEWFQVSPLLEAKDFEEGVPRKSRAVSLNLGSDGGFFDRRRRLDVSVVVNCCHGGPGEDGSLQAALDLARLPYTGPSMSTALLGMDKLAFGALMASAGLPTLPRMALRAEMGEQAPSFMPPYIVKPRFGGSSIGIEAFEDLMSAAAYARTSPHTRDGAVLEPFLEGSRDLNIAIRTYPEFQLSAIEAPKREGVYTYAQKYLQGGGLEGSPRELPADIPDTVSKEIQMAARRVASLLGCRSVMRLDFLLSGDELWINEINTIPGSLASYLWIDPPIQFKELLGDMIQESSQRPPRVFSTAGSDPNVLRSARSIASKLT